MAKAEKVKDPNKLGMGRLLAYKSSDVAAAAVSFVVLQYLTLYCTDRKNDCPGACLCHCRK